MRRNESELHLHPLKWIIFYNSCLCRWWLQLPFVFYTASCGCCCWTVGTASSLLFAKLHIKWSSSWDCNRSDNAIWLLFFSYRCAYRISLWFSKKNREKMCILFTVQKWSRCCSVWENEIFAFNPAWNCEGEEKKVLVFNSNFPLIISLSFLHAAHIWSGFGLSCSLSLS